MENIGCFAWGVVALEHTIRKSHRTVSDDEKRKQDPDKANLVNESLCLRWYLLVKRTFDIIGALLGIILMFVPMILIALSIALTSKGPVLLKQLRRGQYGKPFYIVKFRTLYRDAPDNVATALLGNLNDYLTPVGRVLRKTSLDELPQLLNVLRGEMSLVGFRPVVMTEQKLNALREQYGIFICKPGITGLAQVSGRDDLPYREKARIDAIYKKRRSIRLDLYCLFKTIPVAISQRGAK